MLVCYIQKYVIILGEIPVDVPLPKYWGMCPRHPPAGLTPVVSPRPQQPGFLLKTRAPTSESPNICPPSREKYHSEFYHRLGIEVWIRVRTGSLTANPNLTRDVITVILRV